MNEQSFTDSLREAMVDHFLQRLNAALDMDRNAVSTLFTLGVPVKPELSTELNFLLTDDPEDQSYFLRVLGIINGLLGLDEHGLGPITMCFDSGGMIRDFRRTVPSDYGK